MIETERIILRPWRDGEAAAFMAINNEPEVLEWMGELTLAQAEQRLARYNASYEKFGFGRVAAERKSDGVLLGSAGIMHAFETLPVAGMPEIGWRLGRAAWGQGYAVEGARALLSDAFEKRGLSRIIAIINEGNARSHAVAQRLGMRRVPELDYQNPDYPEGHRFRPTQVYAIDNGAAR